MTVSCEVCGKSVEAKRSTKRFCGDTCRKRANLGAKVVDHPAARSAVVTIDLVASVRSDLEDSGVVDTAAGQQALMMAARMTGENAETGSSYAALSRELSRVMSEAKSGAQRRADPLDEIAARRQQKAASA